MERVLIDTDEMTVTEITSDGWPDAVGSTRCIRTEWKIPQPGSDLPDLATLAERLAAVAESVDYLLLTELEGLL